MPRSKSRSLVQDTIRSRRHWRTDDARAVLERLTSSGLSVQNFAAREGLNVARLYRWRKAIASVGAPGSPTPAFLEVARGPRPGVEVVLPTGVILRVPNGFEDETVRRLVEILEGQPPRC